MKQQGHEAAWQQARRELKVVQEETKQIEALQAKATAAEKTHSPQHVEDLRQQAESRQAASRRRPPAHGERPGRGHPAR